MILFSTQNFLPSVGGTQIFVTGLADALAARGHGVEIYCDSAKPDLARKVDEARDYKIVRFGGLRPIRRRKKARAVTERLVKGDVTALITDTWKSLEHLKAESLEGVRVLCLAHGSEFLHMLDSEKGKRLAACLAKADIVAANSRFTADLIKPFASGKTEIRLLSPGVSLPLQRGPRILTIARLEPRKGIDAVIRALPALTAIHPGLQYDVVGNGDDKSRLAALARQLGVSANVHFHGCVSEEKKADLLRSAYVFALANRREAQSVEGFGLAFLEAASYGVPSIAGADGGARDAVLDGKTGLIVEGGNDQAVHDALTCLLSDTAMRNAMGAAARARFRDEFTWDKAAPKFEAALFGGESLRDTGPPMYHSDDERHAATAGRQSPLRPNRLPLRFHT